MGLFGGGPRALRKRVQRDLQTPAWSVLADGRSWVCPFCAVVAIKRLPPEEDPRVDAVLGHLEGQCPDFQAGDGVERGMAELRRVAGARELRSRVKKSLAKRRSWQLLDVEREWYCPFCGDGSGVQVPKNGQMGEEVLAGIIEHVDRCYAFEHGRGEEKPLEHLKGLVKKRNKTLKLIENVRRKLEGDPAWRRQDTEQRWVCPYCLVAQPQIDLSTTLLMFENAPGQIATHLLENCGAYRSGAQPQPYKGTGEVAIPGSGAFDRADSGRQPVSSGLDEDTGSVSVLPVDSGTWQVLGAISGEGGPRPPAPATDPYPDPFSDRDDPFEDSAEISGRLPFPDGEPVGSRRWSGGNGGGGPATTPDASGRGQSPHTEPYPTEPGRRRRSSSMLEPPLPSQAGYQDEQSQLTLRKLRDSGILRLDDNDQASLSRRPPSGPEADTSTAEQRRLEVVEELRKEIERELKTVRELEPSASGRFTFAGDERGDALPSKNGLQEALARRGVTLRRLHLPANRSRGDFAVVKDLGQERLALFAGGVAMDEPEGPIVATTARSLLEQRVAPQRDPGQVLTDVNAHLYRDLDGRNFFTAILAVIDLPSMCVRLCRAGGAAPVVMNPRRNPPLWRIGQEGMAMGIDRGPIFHGSLEVKTIQLAPGDLLVVYNLGLLESRTPGREEFGLERFEQLIQRYGTHEVEYFTDKLEEYFDTYHGSARRQRVNDACLLALKWDAVGAAV